MTDLTQARALAAAARADTSDGLVAREKLPDVVDALLGMFDDSAMHERLRLIALVMHGLDGYADACEDDGQLLDAETVRESVAEVRALLPGAADPAGIQFEWATRFTSVTGREFTYPAPCEGDALEVVLSVTPSESARWMLMRRVVGPWVGVPAGVEVGDA